MGSMDENAPPMDAAPVGVAKIVCTLLEGRSVLSTVAHRQPVRVQPLPSALSAAAGAACAVLSSLGGGLLGDLPSLGGRGAPAGQPSHS